MLAYDNYTLDLVKEFVENGADVNVIGSYNIMNNYTPLMLVSHDTHNLEIVKYLVEHGANVNYNRADLCHTPLFIACQMGNYDIAEYLISQGANVNAKLCGGEKLSVLQVVCGGSYRGNNIEIARLLIQHGANVNYKERYGRTALHRLLIFPYGPQKTLEICKLLVKNGAKIDKEILSLNGPKICMDYLRNVYAKIILLTKVKRLQNKGSLPKHFDNYLIDSVDKMLYYGKIKKVK